MKVYEITLKQRSLLKKKDKYLNEKTYTYSYRRLYIIANSFEEAGQKSLNIKLYKRELIESIILEENEVII